MNIINTIINTILIFIELIEYIIFFDIILSWLTMLWIRFRPEFIKWIIDPIYKKIRKIIPTTIWYLDFTPIIVILALEAIKTIIISIFSINIM